MGDNKEKRMISNTGYEIKQAFDIGGIEVMLGENTKAENNHFYLVCNYKEYGIIGEFSQAVSFDDYFEAVEDYKTRIFNEIEKIKIERDNAGLPVELFTSEHCYPHNRDESIAEQVIIIKPEALSPEYRRGDVQLFYATHGNGIRANANGNAVYGYYLYNGQQSRIERYEVMGVIKELPEWAKEHLARVLSEKEKPTEDKQFAGRYEIIERVEVGEKIFALGYHEKAAAPYGTWQGHKSSKGNFDWGHYFMDYETARDDMNARADKERDAIPDNKRKRDENAR